MILGNPLFLFSFVLFVLVSFPFIGLVGASSMMWSQTYGGKYDDRAYSLVEMSDGGYALAGGELLVKTDEYGVMEWNRTYQVSARSLIVTSDGGFALAGGVILLKLDAYGNVEWNQTYSGSINSLIETSDGGYALCGYTRSFGAGEDDFWLVKTDEYGVVPEFPSWTPMLLLFTTLAVTLAIYKRRMLKTQIRHHG